MRQPGASKSEPRVCGTCKSEFRPKRPWQTQCSQKCRQRAYRNRQATEALGYYGA